MTINHGLCSVLLLSVLVVPVRGNESPGGTVAGTVTYEADAGRPWRYARFYVKNGRLAEAVVAVESEGVADKKRKPVKHVVDQKDFRFVPETTLLRAGDSVEFTNSDPQVHNVFTGDLTPFNVNTPPEGSHVTRFPKAGGTEKPVRIGCIYHSNMQAFLYVFDHPHFALTGETGRFEIKGLPPGKHRLMITHPSGRLRREVGVTVTAGETTMVDVALSPDDLIKRKPVKIP